MNRKEQIARVLLEEILPGTPRKSCTVQRKLEEIESSMEQIINRGGSNEEYAELLICRERLAKRRQSDIEINKVRAAVYRASKRIERLCEDPPSEGQPAPGTSWDSTA